MKAVRLHEYKRPPSVDEVPQPDLESHDDVLVRVGGAGVCRTNLHLIDGWFADVMPAEVPFTLGQATTPSAPRSRWFSPHRRTRPRDGHRYQL